MLPDTSVHQNTFLIQRKTTRYLVLPNTFSLLLQHLLARRGLSLVACIREYLRAQTHQTHAINEKEIEGEKLDIVLRVLISLNKKFTPGASWSDFRFLSHSATATCCKITK